MNFLGDAGEAESAYGEETYRRLVELKDEYDPTNVFRLNQNVAPSAVDTAEPAAGVRDCTPAAAVRPA